jgi:hypothetical protein
MRFRSSPLLRKWVLIGSMLPLCWLGMMAVHELGHILGASCTGGVVKKVVIHPLAISRTDVAPNPSPLSVVWAGPLVGVLLPLLAWAILLCIRAPGLYLFRFFAGFCLITNGAYIGAGSFGQIGDAGEMIKYGTPMFMLWLFGLVTVPLGLLLWHRLGAHFGLGHEQRNVNAWTASWALCALIVTYVAAFLVSPRS